MTTNKIIKTLESMANPEYAAHAQHFFKTGKGEYGEGDKFLGIRVPELRKMVRRYKGLQLENIEKFLSSEYHEIRLFGFLFLAVKFKTAGEADQEKIYTIYMSHKQWVNNWDIVDTTAPNVIGRYLLNRDRKVLRDMAESENLWDRRIAILSTFTFIKNMQFEDCIRISEILLYDKEDLIHKAVGWMLREIGKRDMRTEETFLKLHYKKMPRTMLRYAIEKFDEEKRKAYLKGNV